jgi:hypothetical protein
MKHRGFLVLLAWLVILPLLPTSVAAANSQGLHWDYGNSSKTFLPGGVLILPHSTIHYDIPSEVTTWEDIPIVYWDAQYQTGEDIYDLIPRMFEYLPMAGNRLFLPVGNWGLLSSLIEDECTGATVSSDDRIWGFTLNATLDLNWTAVLTMTYEKEDGWIMEYEAELYNGEGDFVESRRTYQRNNPVDNPPLVIPEPLIAVGVVAILILGCLSKAERSRIRI